MYENSYSHPFLIGRMGEVLVKSEVFSFYDEAENFEEYLYSMNADMSNDSSEEEDEMFYF